MYLTALYDPEVAERFRFDELPGELFEELCFLLAQIEIPGLERTSAPDGGLDAVKRTPGAGAERGIQAKRHQHIAWKKCEASLDAALASYGVRHVTFTFARDLTYTQIKRFEERLESRHEEVLVDYWGASQLTAKLLAGERGRQVARHIFGEGELERLERAMRAQREIDTTGHAIEALGGISSKFGDDPYFDYHLSSRPRDAPDPGMPAGDILRVQFDDGRSIANIDAIATDAAIAAGRLPRAHFEIPNRTEQERFERLLREQGSVRLGGIAVRFEQLPKHFEEHFSAITTADVVVRAADSPVLEIGIEISSDKGQHDSKIGLREIGPHPEWDNTYQGEGDGVTLTLSLREGGGGAEINVTWGWQFRDAHGTRERLAGAEQMLALSGTGTVRFTDPRSGRVIFEGETPEGGEFDGELAGLRQIFEDLLALEDWLGHPIELEEDMDGEEAAALRRVAELIGGTEKPWNQVTLRGTEPKDPTIMDVGKNLEMRREIELVLFGRPMAVGVEVTRIDRFRVASVEDDEHGLPRFTLEPPDPSSAKMSLRLERSSSNNSFPASDPAGHLPGKPLRLPPSAGA